MFDIILRWIGYLPFILMAAVLIMIVIVTAQIPVIKAEREEINIFSTPAEVREYSQKCFDRGFQSVQVDETYSESNPDKILFYVVWCGKSPYANVFDETDRNMAKIAETLKEIENESTEN